VAAAASVTVVHFIRTHDGCSDWDGTDQVLGLFSIDGYSDDNLKADVQMYKDTSKITSNTVVVQCNRADGTYGKCAAAARAEKHGCDGNSGELIGDIDMALAMAPGLSYIVVIEDELNQFAGALNWVATGACAFTS
jgi:hypothetical protein